MTSQQINLEFKGLYTAPNNLSGIPAGALEIAENVVLNSKNLIESRRGQTQYANALTLGTGQVNKIFTYTFNQIISYDNKMAYDPGGIWIDYTGTYSQPNATYKMRSLEAAGNFYFNSSNGVYKIDNLFSNPVIAGVAKALGGEVVVSGGSGFLLNNSAVAYRVVWGYSDANSNLNLGAPSQRLVAVNDSGTSGIVTLTISIPSTITTSYFYQIYRSEGTATASDEPSDELQLVLQANPTGGEITAKSFTVADNVPYSLMRATLYTSPSQEGIANANNPPPFCTDMALFKNSAFYANVKQRQGLLLTLISVDFNGPSFGYFTDASVATTLGSPTLTTISSTTNIRVGMRVVGAGIPVGTTVLAIAGPTSLTMSADATATASVTIECQDRITIAGVDYFGGVVAAASTNTFFVDNSGTPAQNINISAQSLVEIVNTSPSNTNIYGFYVSGVEDLPGQMFFEERSVNGASFSANSTEGTSFVPVLPSSGSAVSSINNERPNQVFISKPSQVEAVPSFRFINIGSANFPINKVVALRDGIFFFKDDGIYRLSGEDFSSFTVNLIDNTVKLLAPESAVAFNNQIFFYSNQGICAVTDSGVRIMSVPIEDEILKLASDQYAYFSNSTFGVAYESSRLYLVWTVTEPTDTYATQAFCYNSLTDTWSKWIMSRTCGIVNTTFGQLFMGVPNDSFIRIERKSFTNAEYADEQYTVTIASVDSSTQITLVSATNVVAGMTIIQGDRNAYVESVLGNVLTITPTTGLTAANATAYTPIQNKIKWVPIDGDNPGILKQFSEVTFFFKNAAFREIEAGFSSNISPAEQIVTITNNGGFGQWGASPWGALPWGGGLGGSIPLRTYVPREKQRASWEGISLTTNEAFTGFSLQGVSIVFNPMSTRFR